MFFFFFWHLKVYGRGEGVVQKIYGVSLKKNRAVLVSKTQRRIKAKQRKRGRKKMKERTSGFVTILIQPKR